MVGHEAHPVADIPCAVVTAMAMGLTGTKTHEHSQTTILHPNPHELNLDFLQEQDLQRMAEWMTDLLVLEGMALDTQAPWSVALLWLFLTRLLLNPHSLTKVSVNSVHTASWESPSVTKHSF